jgi:hypothetical protein
VSHVSTHLASGTINPHGDSIAVELVQSQLPAVIRITWPTQPTEIIPVTFADVVQEVATILVYAQAAHTRIEAVRGGGQ